jgi:hypothetical protein
MGGELTFKGTSAASGAGRPPQKEVNETTSLEGEARIWESSAIAEQWSIPGSSPISFKSKTFAALALLKARTVSHLLQDSA